MFRRQRVFPVARTSHIYTESSRAFLRNAWYLLRALAALALPMGQNGTEFTFETSQNGKLITPTT